MTLKRMTREDRRERLEHAIRNVLEVHGMRGLTRQRVADLVGCTVTMVNHHFGSANGMREWAAKDAVKGKRILVLRRMLAEGHAMPRMPRELKEKIK